MMRQCLFHAFFLELIDADALPTAGVCASGFKLIYAWAMNAPALHLPEGVSFKLPARDSLVVQVHYNNVDKFVNR